MRIYRVCYESISEGGQGFRWFLNKRVAQKDLAAFKRFDSRDTKNSKVQAIDFTLTKKGIIALLNVVANHADNG